MNLQLENKYFITCGASSGFGKAIARSLLQEGARVLAIARNQDQLSNFSTEFPGQVDILAGDLTKSETLQDIVRKVADKKVDGMLVNSGGPPVKTIKETTMQDWDDAYHSILRWKVELIKMILPYFEEQAYGRILVIESSSVKQPIENLVLSTSLRLAIVGFVKTLVQENNFPGITMNIIAPGSHDTPAIARIIEDLSKKQDISFDEAKKALENKIPARKLGNPTDFASLATWLLSPLSNFVTGQTISVDGGIIKATI